MEYYTYFIYNKKQIGSASGILPIQKDMLVKLHGYENDNFIVDHLVFKYDHPDTNPGLYVYLEK